MSNVRFFALLPAGVDSRRLEWSLIQAEVSRYV